MALDQYNQEGDRLVQQYGMLGDMADTEYGRYQDALSQYWQNLSYQKQLADDAYDQGYNNWYTAYQQGYQAERDKVADQQWQTEFDEAKRQYDQEYAFAQQQYTDSQKKSTSSGGSSSGGSSSSSKGNSGGTSYDTHGYNSEQIKQLQRNAGIAVDGIWGPDTEKAYKSGYRPDKKATYNSGELLDATAAGMTKSQIEEVLKARGVDTSDPAVQADIKWALSK